jgi:hypothetical protein
MNMLNYAAHGLPKPLTDEGGIATWPGGVSWNHAGFAQTVTHGGFAVPSETGGEAVRRVKEWME